MEDEERLKGLYEAAGLPDPEDDATVLARAINNYPSLMVAISHIIIACEVIDTVDSFAMNLQMFVEMQTASVELEG